MRRDDRWLIRWQGDRIVWAAATDRGRVLLTRERLLLQLLRGRLPFEVPVVITENADGTADLRTFIPGLVDPWAVYRRVVQDTPFALRLGEELGNALAAIHTKTLGESVESWLPQKSEWPVPPVYVMERLHRVVDDPLIHAGAERVLHSHTRIEHSLQPHERVLVHGDLGFHNLVLSPDTLNLRGIFDWEAACWSDPHLDFRYLLADLDHTTLFEAATASYTTSGGQPITRSRVLLYNAVSAISFLAYRDGIPPETRWCGRTLEEDLAWTRRALLLLGPSDGCAA